MSTAAGSPQGCQSNRDPARRLAGTSRASLVPFDRSSNSSWAARFSTAPCDRPNGGRFRGRSGRWRYRCVPRPRVRPTAIVGQGEGALVGPEVDARRKPLVLFEADAEDRVATNVRDAERLDRGVGNPRRCHAEIAARYLGAKAFGVGRRGTRQPGTLRSHRCHQKHGHLNRCQRSMYRHDHHLCLTRTTAVRRDGERCLTKP